MRCGYLGKADWAALDAPVSPTTVPSDSRVLVASASSAA